jgi:arylsulfatase A-like enzyme
MMAQAPKSRSTDFPISSLFLTAVWFGLMGGLIEGLTYWALQGLRLLAWPVQNTSINFNIVWASTLFDLAIFLAAACPLAPLVWLFRRQRWLPMATAIFATMAFYGVLSVPGVIREFGVLMLALGMGVVLSRRLSRCLEEGLVFMRRTMTPLVTVAILLCLGVVVGNNVWERVQVARLPAPPPSAPNILLLVADTLRADRLGSYGYNRPTTPFLDEFARSSVLFERVFADASWTMPSHASIFTGRLPYEHGATLTHYDGRFTTLAQALGTRGYVAAGFVANDIGLDGLGLAGGFVHFENTFTSPADAFVRTAYGRKVVKYLFPHFLQGGILAKRASEIDHRFLAWLDHRPSRPFFAYLNYMEVHDPWVPPLVYAQRFSDRPDEISPQDRLHWGRRPPVEPARADKDLNDVYDACLAALDDQLRSLFAELHQRNLDTNLIVIFTSDHGESLGEHNLVGHRHSLYLEQIRVPLMVRVPGHTPDGKRIPEIVGLDSLAATIAELAGVHQETFHGPSLVPCWSGGPCGRGIGPSELSGGHFPGIAKDWPIYQGWIRSLANSRWHLVVQQDGHIALFDWLNDPKEIRNLASTSEGEAVLPGLWDGLIGVVPDVRDAFPGGPPNGRLGDPNALSSPPRGFPPKDSGSRTAAQSANPFANLSAQREGSGPYNARRR